MQLPVSIVSKLLCIKVVQYSQSIAIETTNHGFPIFFTISSARQLYADSRNELLLYSVGLLSIAVAADVVVKCVGEAAAFKFTSDSPLELHRFWIQINK